MAAPTRLGHRGFTLVEVLVAIVIVSVLLTIAAPSLRELIVKQRLKSVTAELVTDLQYARTEVVSRNLTQLRIQFKNNSTMSCYLLYLPPIGVSCDCTLPPGSACSGATVNGLPAEIRATQVMASTDVQFATVPSGGADLILNPDGMQTVSTDYVVLTSRVSGGAGQLKIIVNAMGRPSVCSPDLSINGVPACP